MFREPSENEHTEILKKNKNIYKKSLGIYMISTLVPSAILIILILINSKDGVAIIPMCIMLAIFIALFIYQFVFINKEMSRIKNKKYLVADGKVVKKYKSIVNQRNICYFVDVKIGEDDNQVESADAKAAASETEAAASLHILKRIALSSKEYNNILDDAKVLVFGTEGKKGLNCSYYDIIPWDFVEIARSENK